MKNVAIAIMTCFLMIVNYSCNKCKNPTYVPRAKLMEEYFGNYKPGAYWIYLNRDSTKRDSIWVDNFEVQKETDNTEECIYAYETFFDMHCTYLDATKKLRVYIGFNGSDIKVNTIEMKTTLGGIYGSIYAQDGIDSFFTIGGFGQVHKLINYRLWDNNSNTNIPIATRWGRFIIAPHLCIVQYIPVNSQDTFSLVEHYTP